MYISISNNTYIYIHTYIYIYICAKYVVSEYNSFSILFRQLKFRISPSPQYVQSSGRAPCVYTYAKYVVSGYNSYIHTYIYIHIYEYIYINICIYVCIYLYETTRIYIYIHIHTCKIRGVRTQFFFNFISTLQIPRFQVHSTYSHLEELCVRIYM